MNADSGADHGGGWSAGTEGGNNGVLVHASTPRALGIWPKSIEVQLLKGNAGDLWVIGTDLDVPDEATRKEGRWHKNLTDGSERDRFPRKNRQPGIAARLAIRPYPTQCITPWTAKDGTQVILRAIRPEDEPLVLKFQGTLSDRSVSLRYFHAMKYTARVAHERLTRRRFIDYDREMALVADRKNPETGEHEILGGGRLIKIRGTKGAELSLLVSDRFQGRGLGTELVRRLLQVGRDENIDRIFGDILPENVQMQRICEKLGFKMTLNVKESLIRAEIEL